MEVQQVLHMVGGEGETSYANNSAFPRKVISKVKPIIEETIVDLYCTTFPQNLVISDLGCSSGPNTLLVISEIIDVIEATCFRLSRQSPEFQVFLNDLPGNDFNTIFRSLPNFNVKLKKEKGDEFGPCFVSGVPGSFYGRLFRCNSLNFVHSSYSLHWLSKGLIEEAKLDSFNLPYYAPSAEEVKRIIQTEGSFKIDRLESFESHFDANVDDDDKEVAIDKFISGQNVSKCIRSVGEPILASHFGEAILHDFFPRFTEKVVEQVAKDECKCINLVISMTKNGSSYA
ncbi:hypothetical protein HHK36_010167 [Tetracentron sinense]|uniref:Uncharacterized protein n=1 Tax=Tetracentron sinense TaxID=13715 RepID=A0A834ZEI5_TETSI|nr:hypothetical protein HHK36_010167 [Tetracentron sinense]